MYKLFKPIVSFIRSHIISNTNKEPLVFIEIIPRNITDIVSKSLYSIPKGSGYKDNEFGFKSFNDAIINAQNIGFCLIENIKPENLLFVFSETMEGFFYSFRDFCIKHSISYPMNNWYASVYRKQRYSNNQNKTEMCAIILCKIVNIQFFQEIFIPKQQKGGGDSKCYEITWGELQTVQEKLYESTSNHFSTHNLPVYAEKEAEAINKSNNAECFFLKRRHQ